MFINIIKNNLSTKILELKTTSQKMCILISKLEYRVPGIISYKMIGNKPRYYRRNDNKDNVGEYLSPDNEEIIKNLELKNYYEQLQKAAIKEVSQLESLLLSLNNIYDIDWVYYDIPEQKRHLIEPDYLCKTTNEINSWKNKFIKRKNIPTDTGFVTSSGIRVRSKSELIIAERFEKNNIPYKYECPVFVDKQLWYPDFTVMNKRTGNEYYWEHFGLLDDKEYCSNFISKMEIYTKEGIIYGKNLIYTAENSQYPLSTSNIDVLIKQFLL